MYVIIHNDENRWESFDDLASAQRCFYLKWRDDDGSIPWKMFYGDYEIDPANGFILGR